MLEFLNYLISKLDIAVVVQDVNSSGKYELYGFVPKFYEDLFSDINGKSYLSEPWKVSLMLECFYNEAVTFFKSGKEGTYSSEAWQEDCNGKELLLVAMAAHVGGVKAIIVRNLTHDFPNHIKMVQTARESLLKHNKLTKTLDFYKNKSNFDSLTALYNRGAFNEIVTTELNSREFDSDAALLMVDIDDFKNINDTYGHLEGDRVLKDIGRIFTSTLRKNDIVARYGGEEFIIFAPYTNPTQALTLGEKLRASIEKYKFINLPMITISIGVAVYTVGEDLESIIRRADSALYDAKRSGKNMVKFR